MDITEKDWKLFKKIHPIALERFSERVLNASQGIFSNEQLSAHDKYIQLYEIFHQSNKRMAQLLDDYRRSTAIMQINLLFAESLITQAELSQFSAEIQNICLTFRCS